MANSPWSASYEAIWSTEGSLRIGDIGIEMDLAHWVNDGLMAVFFFVVGMMPRLSLLRSRLPVLAIRSFSSKSSMVEADSSREKNC